MRISFKIERSEAVIAIMYYLSIGVKITTQSQFKEELNTYFRQHGFQDQDNHESDCQYFKEDAEFLVNKYFTK